MTRQGKSLDTTKMGKRQDDKTAEDPKKETGAGLGAGTKASIRMGTGVGTKTGTRTGIERGNKKKEDLRQKNKRDPIKTQSFASRFFF